MKAGPRSRFAASSGWRVGAAAVAAVLVAEAAAWLLRPRETPIAPAPVATADYFTQAQIDRGRSYADGQLWLFVAGLGIQGGALIVLALGHPRGLRRRIERLAGHPVRGAALVGAGLSVGLTVVTLPTAIAAHERAVSYGLSTQDLGSWLGDAAKSTAIGAALAAGGAALLMALVRRFERRWWIPGAVAATLLAALFTWLAPVLLAPLFNKFKPLPESSPARAEVLALGRRAGVDIGEVYRVDASRRVTALNAYVDGLGPTKRVVLYDTLLKHADRPELRSVVAHELGHVKHDDVPRGLLFVALVAPLGLLFARELAGALTRRAGIDPGAPAALPAYALAIGLTSLLLTIPGDQLSRQVEASADTFALRLTHDPHALISLQRRLAISNVGDPDPPGLVTALVGTHPSTIDRIGAAVAYEHAHESGAG
jgi:STE24 endopeptidase